MANVASQAHGIDSRSSVETLTSSDAVDSYKIGPENIPQHFVLWLREITESNWKVVELLKKTERSNLKKSARLVADIKAEPGKEYEYQVVEYNPAEAPEVVAIGRFGIADCPFGYRETGLRTNPSDADDLTVSVPLQLDSAGYWGDGTTGIKPDDVYMRSVTNGSGAVLMIAIQGHYFPANQFIIGAAAAPEPGHSCSRPHYHAFKSDVVYGLRALDSSDAVILPDIHPVICGYGQYDDLERVNIPVSAEQRGAPKELISSF